MKALVLKELRELFGIAVVALACYLALVANVMGAKVFDWVPGFPDGKEEIPFTGTSSEFALWLTLISVVLAVALGLRQTVGESARGTFQFLLHRPLTRNRIFFIKLASGLGVFFACVSVPILTYGCWAAVPGHHASPFEWSMTAPAWWVALLSPTLYFAAFLSGLRPARWFGTRLLPLAAVAILLLGLARTPLRWSFDLTFAAVLYAVLAANVCYVARVRDYA